MTAVRFLFDLGAIASLGLFVTVTQAQLVPPTAVGGKEFSDNQDVDANVPPNPDPLANLSWDGLGNVADAFDYTNSGPPPADPDQVDALANEQDYQFQSLLNDQVPMIISLQGENFLRSHKQKTGTVGIWATAQQIRGVAAGGPPTEVDAVELWGDDSSRQHNGLAGFDANHYSYIGDPVPPNPPGGGFPPVSIFVFTPSGPGPVPDGLGGTDVDGIFGSSTPYILHDPLRDQLNQDLNFDLSQVDVDALMVFDVEGDMQWAPGDSIIFSLRPSSVLDGGELFVWNNGSPITYLQHGGRTWDTANPVAAIFGANTENIDALEALVPEPSSLGMIVLGALLAACWRRRTWLG